MRHKKCIFYGTSQRYMGQQKQMKITSSRWRKI